jgi:PAS domain S-box-containing protein
LKEEFPPKTHGPSLISPCTYYDLAFIMSAGSRYIENAFCFLFILFTLLFSPFGAAFASSQNQIKNPLKNMNVLILNAYESNVPAFQKIDLGLSATLLAGGIGNRNQFYEHLDIVELLRRRYTRRRIDFIVTIYPEALKFLIEECRGIFSDPPVLALLLPEGFALPDTGHRIIPHLVIPDLKRTLGIALKLVSRAKDVYVVNGTHPIDRWLENIERRDFKPWEDRLDFHYLSDRPVANILSTVSGVPPDSIVLLGTFARDVNGEYFTAVEMSRRLARSSAAPVFGFLDVHLGNGIVGGSLISLEHVGTRAGELVLDVLRGARYAEDIPNVLEVSQLDIFDWKELRRWHLDESVLPRGSIIVNRDFNLWDLKYYAVGILAFILAQSVLIAWLLAHRRARRSAEGSLRQKSEELEHFFEVSLDLLCVASTDGHLLLVNPAWERTLGFGREELMAKPFLNFIHPEDLVETKKAISTLVSGGKVIHFENRYRCRDGAYRRLEWSAVSAGSLIYAAGRDVTNRMKVEAESRQRRDELAHMTRIATMGELTTSLAHEINQPLAAILSNAEAARRFLSRSRPDIGEVRQILEDIIRDDRRAGDVVHKLRALVKKKDLRQEPLDLNQVVQEVVALIRGELLQQGVSIAVKSSPDVGRVLGDRIQLQQVLLNLILNGAAAMRSSPPGQRNVIIKTDMPDSGTVRASVTDFGTGIDENAVDRLFEPFYTTKPEGLGMGLSISRTIISAHGGTVGASNDPEGGATFAFRLPAHRGDAP